jgi:CPA1 family monovalent cation:H+ antiporter
MGVLDIITILLILASIFTFVNAKYMKVSPTIGLMLQSFTISIIVLIIGYFVPSFKSLATNTIRSFDFSEVLLHVMLSFLLFAGALHIEVEMLKEEKWPILVLTTFGVLVSTLVVGYFLFYLLPLIGLQVDLITCLLFGALISPTDPIAVLAILKQTTMSKNLEIKIAGESLFNDGVGVVAYLTVLAIAQKGASNVEISEVMILFLQEVVGGLILGFFAGWLCVKILVLISNEEIELEVLISLAFVMGSYKICEVLGFSGPLAMVVLGIYVGHQGHKKNIFNEHFYKFWSLIDDTMNAILFILVGFEMLIISFEINYLVAGLISILVVLFSRYVSVALPIKLFQIKREFAKKTTLILTWGGLRGGLSVALALSLPPSPHKDMIITITYCVVVFSILVQGLTIQKLLGKPEKV